MVVCGRVRFFFFFFSSEAFFSPCDSGAHFARLPFFTSFCGSFFFSNVAEFAPIMCSHCRRLTGGISPQLCGASI